jgi:DNA helicase II / ATP-dependent DNA helicase PcrA
LSNFIIESFFDELSLSNRKDLEVKTAGLVKDNELERENNRCIRLLIEALDKNLEESVHYLMV